MEKKEVTTINPVTVAGVTIIPVSKLKIDGWHGKQGAIFSGSRQPDIVIFATPSSKRAFRITGEEITINQLTREIPETRGILRQI